VLFLHLLVFQGNSLSLHVVHLCLYRCCTTDAIPG